MISEGNIIKGPFCDEPVKIEKIEEIGENTERGEKGGASENIDAR
jgi:hypothetical protein